MSAVVEVYILCDSGISDECDETLGVDDKSTMRAYHHRKTFKVEGWHRYKGKDICFACWECTQSNQIRYLKKEGDMKEIKFRAWIKSVKKMADWDSMLRDCDRLSLLEGNDNFIVQQFIGLLDKNGKEVYKDDFVRCHQFTQELGENLGVYEGEKETVCIVTYIKENACFGFVEINSEDRGYIEPALCSDEGIEIIGNIHENPELHPTKSDK